MASAVFTYKGKKYDYYEACVTDEEVKFLGGLHNVLKEYERDYGFLIHYEYNIHMYMHNLALIDVPPHVIRELTWEEIRQVTGQPCEYKKIANIAPEDYAIHVIKYSQAGPVYTHVYTDGPPSAASSKFYTTVLLYPTMSNKVVWDDIVAKYEKKYGKLVHVHEEKSLMGTKTVTKYRLVFYSGDSSVKKIAKKIASSKMQKYDEDKDDLDLSKWLDMALEDDVYSKLVHYSEFKATEESVQPPVWDAEFVEQTKIGDHNPTYVETEWWEEAKEHVEHFAYPMQQNDVAAAWQSATAPVGSPPGVDDGLEGALNQLTRVMPELRNAGANCPACLSNGLERNKNVYNIIIHLNDRHKWSREDIADWLDMLGLDLTFPTPDVDEKGGDE